MVMCWHLITILFNYFNARSYGGWDNNVLLFYLPFLFVSFWRISCLCHSQLFSDLFFSSPSKFCQCTFMSVFLFLTGTQSWNIKDVYLICMRILKLLAFATIKGKCCSGTSPCLGDIANLCRGSSLVLPVEAIKGRELWATTPLLRGSDPCGSHVKNPFCLKREPYFYQMCTDQRLIPSSLSAGAQYLLI